MSHCLVAISWKSDPYCPCLAGGEARTHPGLSLIYHQSTLIIFESRKDWRYWTTYYGSSKPAPREKRRLWAWGGLGERRLGEKSSFVAPAGFFSPLSGYLGCRTAFRACRIIIKYQKNEKNVEGDKGGEKSGDQSTLCHPLGEQCTLGKPLLLAKGSCNRANSLSAVQPPDITSSTKVYSTVG